MLDLEVVPEHSLRHKSWEVILGMPIQQIIDIFKKNDSIIKSVEFWYSSKVPFHMDLVLYLPNDGIKLHFDSLQQRLKLIEVFDMSKLNLRYYSNCFNSLSTLPTIDEIDRTFGATKPPKYDPQTSDCHITFRGLLFVCSAQMLSDQQKLVHRSADSQSDAIYVARKMVIFPGVSATDVKVPLKIPTECFHGNIYLKKLDLLLNDDGIVNTFVFHLSSQNFTNGDSHVVNFSRTIRFGDSAQDVVSALGSSSRVFYKAEDKMKIHCPQSHRLIQTKQADYFYNYFTLGVDVLLDARNHSVKKMVLHTNFPGHYNFNTYHRCWFEMKLPRDVASNTTNIFTIDPLTKWSAIQSNLSDSYKGEPVILKRSGNGNTVNPFGNTWCFGLKNMIFEIIPSNEHIASVTVYQHQ